MKIYLLHLFLLMSFGVNLQAQNFSDSIRGKVTCNGKGVQGVVVTDGIDCTLTDKQGNYALYPNRDVRFVQMSVPAGYLPQTKKTIPLFYQEVNPEKRNTYNFELRGVL